MQFSLIPFISSFALFKDQQFMTGIIVVGAVFHLAKPFQDQVMLVL